ncbi:MAG: class I adenylate-forming enzyme family protein [SAR324 cluster bacterium]|nr:class I adenylate-forming enzyme family protein [SAR324 cluster bacterium]
MANELPQKLQKLNNLGDLFNRDKDPDKIALIEQAPEGPPRRFSHGEIDRAAAAGARGLVARGYQTGERIAILAANSAEYLSAYLGTMRAGMVSVPVNFKFPRNTIHYILEDAGIKLIFRDREQRDKCPEGLPAVTFGEEGEEGWRKFLDPGEFETRHAAPEDIAMFLYTSGSTGKPKGVPLSHSGQIWAMAARARGSADFEAQRYLIAAPMYHMNALFGAKFCLAMHASMVLLPQFSARAYIEAIGRHQPTWLTSVPTMLALVAREPEALAATDLSSVQVVTMGSAPVSQRLIDEVKQIFPAARIAINFGTTECGPMNFGPHPDNLPRPDTALGYPLPDVGLRLADGGNRDADQGVLELLTPANMPGYHNLPEKTAEVTTDDGWYITGDVLRRDENGFHYFVGRTDDMFVCSGENIYPGEVEKMLEGHPDIQQACVVPVPDEIRGHKPFAFVVPRNGTRLTEQMVKDYALANAPPYQHPRHVEFMTELPLAGTNKVDRNILTERALELAA